MANYGVTELQTLEWFSESNQTRYHHWHNHRHDIIACHETGSVFVEQPDIIIIIIIKTNLTVAGGGSE